LHGISLAKLSDQHDFRLAWLAENLHLPIRRRRRKMLNFKSRNSAQRFLTTHAAIYNVSNVQRHIISRSTLRVFSARSDSVGSKAVA
jgi:transposase-like protein